MKLYRAFATVGGLTLLSRVLGFVRDILFAWAFGAGWVADAFNVAFRFPNLFRRLFGEGAFNSAFIPLFAKELEAKGKEAARAFAEQAMSGLVAVLVAMTIAAIIGMPWLMYLLAPGFSANAREVRPRGAADADHVPLSPVHVARGAVLGRAQHLRQVR